MALRMRADERGVFLDVVLQPRSSREAILGEQQGALRVAVHAPPVEGAANRTLCALLAAQLGLAPSAVQVVRGARSRRKTVLFQEISLTEAEARLESFKT